MINTYYIANINPQIFVSRIKIVQLITDVLVGHQDNINKYQVNYYNVKNSTVIVTPSTNPQFNNYAWCREAIHLTILASRPSLPSPPPPPGDKLTCQTILLLWHLIFSADQFPDSIHCIVAMLTSPGKRYPGRHMWVVTSYTLRPLSSIIALLSGVGWLQTISVGDQIHVVIARRIHN